MAVLLTVAPLCAEPPEGLDFELGGSGAAPGQFADLRDMAFDGQNNLLTLEGPNETADRDKKYRGNMRVQRFDANGKFVGQFSIDDPALAANSGPGRNNVPAHIAGDAGGNVFVSFPGRNLVRKYGPKGEKLADYAVPAANAITSYAVDGRERIAVIGGFYQVIEDKWTMVGGEAITLIEGDKTTIVPLARPLSEVADMTADKAGNFYILAATNTLYKFAPDGKLLKTLGAQNNAQAEDGSELKYSIAVDAKGNVYAMANNFLSRFDAQFQTVTQREVRYRWFEPWGLKMLALDAKDRIWGATPDLVEHPLFEQFHFRPAVVRAAASFFEPQQLGVRTASALGLGLKPSIVPGPAFGVAYDLKEFPSELVIAPANRNVAKISVEYHVFDAYRNPADGGQFEMPLENGKAARAPIPFTPPRFGWYELDVALSAGGRQLTRIAKYIGVTPDFPGMMKLQHVTGMDGTNDAPKQMFVGLPNMRLNAGADPKSLDNLEKVLAVCEKFGAVPFVQFTEEKDVTEASVRAAVTRFKGRVKVWEIVNEPNLRMTPEKYVNDYLKLASRIIHEVDPQAKVMGPTGCGVILPWYEGFYKAGGGPLVDILSIHDYEGHETVDPVHWRWKIGELRKLIARYGDSKKEIWQTERVFSGVRGGDFMGLYQAANLAQHRDLLETLGITPDHNNHFYVNEMGYGEVPSYIWSGNGPHPAAFVLRTRYAQTRGRRYAGTVDFGPTGNDIFSALRYRGNDGQTIVLRNEGAADQRLTLGVRGGTALQVVDAWGNAKSTPLRNGQAELMVPQLPIYLRLAPEQEISTPKIDFGRNLAGSATFSYSARSERPLSLLNNGIIEVIHDGNPNGGTDGGKIWTGEMPESNGKIAPQTLEIKFDTPRTFDKIILRGLRADNQFCTLLDYDVQAEVGGQWKTLAAVRSSVPASDAITAPPTLVAQWNGNEHLFIHRLTAPVTASRVRIIARRATYGFSFDEAASAATQTTWGNYNRMKLMLREVEIYAPHSTAAPATAPGKEK